MDRTAKRSFMLACISIGILPFSQASDLQDFTASRSEILLADFRTFIPQSTSIEAILVLCPGQNADGTQFFEDERWRLFAQSHGLAIVVPHFVSDDEVLRSGRGYFDAKRGSGLLLLSALDDHGLSDLPIMIFGFSGGAHFAMSFAAMRPDLVRGFCAYSFGWFTPPTEHIVVPAIVACGQHDAGRYGASFAYFQQGRSHGLPWLWVSLKDQEHSSSTDLEAFARIFFKSLLAPSRSPVIEVDNISKQLVTAADRRITSILPCTEVLKSWMAIHQP
jgi:pimeloyl-ACP methyl ester carboxylesterase